MKLSFTKSWTVFLALLALTFSAIGVTPAHAAGFVVTKTADTADGTCDADCSLREAIIAANAAPSDDTITVPAGTYTLTIAGADEDAAATGDLDITSNITINGAGAGNTIIQAGTLGVGGPPNGIDRVFHITGAFTVNISGVTARNGNVTSNNGGGIYNLGTLTITNSAFSGNSASSSGGGGIYNLGTLTITNSAFSGNSAPDGGYGGGIKNTAGTLTITNSAFTLNTAESGGGISNSGGTATITNSTFSGNSAVNSGGGIVSLGTTGTTLTITNSTFSGNSAAGDPFPFGGGLRISSGIATLRNTIVANSTSGGNCSGLPITNGGNNIDSGTTCGWGSTSGSMSSTDPLLGALAGSPAYFPLNTGSPAIDAGNDTICAAAPVNNESQNGVTRPQGMHCDIGSVEALRFLLYLSLVAR